MSAAIANLVYLCPYCGSPLALVDGTTVYPQRPDLAHRRFYYCDKGEICSKDPAYVGCHKGTTTPFGRAGNRTLRRLKMEAHEVFDRLWKEGHMSRNEAYRRLGSVLDKHKRITHIGWFNETECIATTQWAEDLLKTLEAKSG